MNKLVLIRHGESTWNLENRFTGWTDVDLTPAGVEQAGKIQRNKSDTTRQCGVARVMPFWNETLAPAIKAGKRAVVAAHGNTIRALVRCLDTLPEVDIVGLAVPRGIPLVYERDDELKPIRHYHLCDAEAVGKAAAAVAAQGKA